MRTVLGNGGAVGLRGFLRGPGKIWDFGLHIINVEQMIIKKQDSDTGSCFILRRCMMSSMENAECREEKRFNRGYRIIESHRAGEAEIVMGHNPHASSPYVCWYCRNGTEYLMGYYGDDFTSVRSKLWERFYFERQMERRRRQYLLQRDARDAGAGRYFNGHGEGDAYGK